MDVVENLPLLEDILHEWEKALGSQYEPYKNHVYRVVNFCFALHECTLDDKEKLIITGCFHDLGIWPDNIVDYLAPSIELAKKYLKENNKEQWLTEIELMIDLHHKCRQVKKCQFPLVEVFRKGDWIDVSKGLRSFGLPKKSIQQVLNVFPNLGFHANLMQLGMAELFKYQRNPLPMMKW